MRAEGCAGGVCHSPAEGVCRRGCAAACPGRPPVWAEGCAIALPRGCAGGGVPEGCHCWKPPHALGGVGIWGAICGWVLWGRGGLEWWGGVCWQSLAGANMWLGTGPGGLCLLWFYGCGGLDVGWLLAKGELEYFGVLVPARLRPDDLAVYR